MKPKKIGQDSSVIDKIRPGDYIVPTNLNIQKLNDIFIVLKVDNSSIDYQPLGLNYSTKEQKSYFQTDEWSAITITDQSRSLLGLPTFYENKFQKGEVVNCVLGNEILKVTVEHIYAPESVGNYVPHYTYIVNWKENGEIKTHNFPEHQLNNTN